MIPYLKSDSELGQWIWENLVPESGQADTLQGELLRANEKLRYESHNNGNMNWDEGFEILIDFLEIHLCKKKRFLKDNSKLLRADLDTLRNYEQPYLEDDLFDRIESEVYNFCRNNRSLIKHEFNNTLYR